MFEPVQVNFYGRKDHQDEKQRHYQGLETRSCGWQQNPKRKAYKRNRTQLFFNVLLEHLEICVQLICVINLSPLDLSMIKALPAPDYSPASGNQLILPRFKTLLIQVRYNLVSKICKTRKG